MELPGDRFAFAQWMEAVTGNRDVVIALYHKPSVRLSRITLSHSFRHIMVALETSVMVTD